MEGSVEFLVLAVCSHLQVCSNPSPRSVEKIMTVDPKLNSIQECCLCPSNRVYEQMPVLSVVLGDAQMEPASGA